MEEFASLESRDAREYWEHEEYDFTPWLAAEIEDRLKSTNTTIYWGDLRETRAGNMRSEVGVKRDADIEDTESWEGYFDWMFEMGELFHDVFPKRLRQLD